VDSYRNVLGVGRYRLHVQKMTYANAVQTCAKEESLLAVPTSKAAEDVMVDILRAAKVQQAFIGVTDAAGEGKMVTVKGETRLDCPW
jgi:Lectin C-type domain